MKGYKVYIIIITLLLGLYFVAEYNRPKSINWNVTLKHADKIPFGTYVLYKQLHDIFPGANITNTNKSIYEVFNDITKRQGNYLIFASSIDIGKADFKALTGYIAKGNNVFISSIQWRDFLSDTLKIETGPDFSQTDIGLNFTNPQLRRNKNYIFKNAVASRYFSRFDTLKVTVIGQTQYGKSNFLRYRFGKGSLFVFASPQVFTNYSLLTRDGAEYAAKVLSYMPLTGNVYWDQYQNHDTLIDESTLRVFFSYPSLTWAFYISLGAMIGFILYEVKRRQRIIPVIEPLKNSTVEFVSVVGRVYYEQRDNRDIAAKKIVYFAEHLRNVFGLKTGTYNNEFLLSFINKTGIEDSLAQDIVNHINFLSHQSSISDHELIVLNQLIEKFYIQSGSYGK